MDPLLRLEDDLASDLFRTGKVDKFTWAPVFNRRSIAYDISFGGRSFLMSVWILLTDCWEAILNAELASALRKVYLCNTKLISYHTR